MRHQNVIEQLHSSFLAVTARLHLGFSLNPKVQM